MHMGWSRWEMPIGGSEEGKKKHRPTSCDCCIQSRSGGVYPLDRALSDLRPVIRGRKWYWPLIINAINIAFVYSWRIYRLIFGEVLSQQKLRRRVVSTMIRRSASQIMDVRSRPARTFKVADEIRLDDVGHYPSPAPVKRCAICKKNCRKSCAKCCQSLHENTCFQLFHEK